MLCATTLCFWPPPAPTPTRSRVPASLVAVESCARQRLDLARSRAPALDSLHEQPSPPVSAHHSPWMGSLVHLGEDITYIHTPEHSDCGSSDSDSDDGDPTGTGSGTGIEQPWCGRAHQESPLRNGLPHARGRRYGRVLVIALVESHRQHPLQDTWESITKLRDSLNVDLKKFRQRQREIYPRLTLSALDVDEPELTAVQLPSYRMKHGQRKATDVDVNNQDSELREAEIQLRCGKANGGILAARDLDYRGQAGITRTARNLQKAELMKTFEITMYNRARAALIHLGHMKKDAVEPYPPLTYRDTRRKETHLHRAKGDSRLFDGTAWYLQSGVTLSSAAVGSTLSPLKRGKESEDDEPEPRLLAGTQTLKRSGFTKSQRTPKRLRDIAPDDVVVVSASSSSEAEDSDVEMSPIRKQGKQRAGKQRQGKKKKSDGWIWLENMTRGQTLGEGRLAEYKEESDRVQWFRAEAEMYRWLEQYERKHAELMRVIERFRRDSEVWVGLGDHAEQQNGGINGAVSFARMQAAMYKRLEHNARVVFKSADSGAHHDWVSATTIDELVKKMDGWRDVVFRWMDDMHSSEALGLKSRQLKFKQGWDFLPQQGVMLARKGARVEEDWYQNSSVWRHPLNGRDSHFSTAKNGWYPCRDRAVEES
ncbi:hypothetical protein C8R44DRAFT_863022 [Mycena epipterygia]|nr:hypothetical protein C8R44DRAFT_863022 [Mycena epipterygia]